MVAERPELAENVVVETLRHDPPVQTCRRIVREPVELAIVAAGADRDPEVFTDPARFDITGANRNGTLSFSAGIHYCLGALPAELEAEVAYQALISRMPRLRPGGCGRSRRQPAPPHPRRGVPAPHRPTDRPPSTTTNESRTTHDDRPDHFRSSPVFRQSAALGFLGRARPGRSRVQLPPTGIGRAHHRPDLPAVTVLLFGLISAPFAATPLSRPGTNTGYIAFLLIGLHAGRGWTGCATGVWESPSGRSRCGLRPGTWPTFRRDQHFRSKRCLSSSPTSTKPSSYALLTPK
ncbi:cytochrome P450 [Streptomyces sp. NBC_01224]|uniref:hypothetical protein n=1 Tax=Streptomyces sp. NBC_01224 TaxID=2903783 RepID=UPI002E13D3E2|nr:cytochrome P450 [Streptomyces sp. NBC_01224]